MADDVTHIVDDPHAPEIFVDMVGDFMVINGVLRATCDAVRTDPNLGPVSAHRRVVLRLVMTKRTAQGLAHDLAAFIASEPDMPEGAGLRPQ